MIIKNLQISEYHSIVRDAFPKLQKFKEQGNQTDFNHSMEEIMSGVKKYISDWLSYAIKNGKIPSNKYKVDDFVNELYIKAYDHFQEVKSDKDLHIWLFQKADELLEDTEIEEDFDNLFFTNIDQYTKAEWKEMEEKYSTDGGGDLVMIEELDDLSYPKNDYSLEDIFIEDGEKPIIEKLNKELSNEQINRHVNLVIQHMSIPERTAFDLAVSQTFNPEEISKIKRSAVKQVIEQISNAKKKIRDSFKNRFFL